MNDSITHVGMDTHKKEHKIAVHYPGQAEIVEFVVQNTARDIKKMVKKIARHAPGKVAFCYEGNAGKRPERLDSGIQHWAVSSGVPPLKEHICWCPKCDKSALLKPRN